MSKKNDLVSNYLDTKIILIVDSSGSARSNISKALNELGARTENIFSTKKYRDAVNYIETKEPEIIITEFDVEDKKGLDLLKFQETKYPKPEERIFIVVTSNSDDSAVAEAAEEDVDSYILKPFVFNYLLENISMTIISKIKPSKYHLQIRDGKELMDKKAYDEAKASFDKAKSLSEQSSLAYYYCGESMKLANNLPVSLSEFEAGLKINENHYKCLMGKYEVLYKMKKQKDAYQIITQIAEKYPLSPKKIGEVFLLAVYTGNYKDANAYFELYQNLDRKTPELQKIVTAGMLACGKFLMRDNDLKFAKEVFQKGIISSNINYEYVRKVVYVFIDNNRAKEAEEYLGKFRLEDKKSKDFKELEFRVLAMYQDDDFLITSARNLIKENIGDEFLFDTLINKLMERESYKAAMNAAYDAISKFPDKKEYFDDYIQKIEAIQSPDEENDLEASLESSDGDKDKDISSANAEG